MGVRDSTLKPRRLRDQIEVAVTDSAHPHAPVRSQRLGTTTSSDPLSSLLSLLDKVAQLHNDTSDPPHEDTATPERTSHSDPERSEHSPRVATVVSEMQKSLEQFMRQSAMLRRLLTKYH